MLKQRFETLAGWVDYFSHQEIPLLQYTLKALRELSGRMEEVSVREIAALIRHDPLLSLKVLRYLQAHRHNAQITDVTTLERTLMMLGIKGFLGALSSGNTVEQQLERIPPALYGCHSACYRAYAASKYAEAICSQRHDIDPAEVMTAALLHDSAEILVWYEAPQLAAQVMLLQQKNPGLRSRDAQRQIFGTTVLDMQMALAHAWHFPKLITHLMDESFRDEPRVRTVLVANSLARHLANGWHDAALPDDFAAVAQLINGDTDRQAAYELVRDTAVKLAREWQWFDVTPPAARLPDLD
ncbi:HDOD domain-containing protein [Chitinilyticum piscinae]|uniref:HDOD domain-containing protein n=1 Tax=Chitinilyticum piscinae TaxID=2866724 RepID=A0A8J7KF18_9NEIS|nr:HDOD domain-containing protein [Chitinilyticum piscinae]MBE9609879.1 HDOD domain-containing protein [Chitinilyticum piscinae]